MSSLPKVIFIVGPTASGKTSLSIEVAKKYNGEIVSSDSMQIYKGIHIASAAPDENEKCGIPHHLIEFLPLTESYSVADYVIAAKNCIDDIVSRGKTPIVVGGTGLYVTSLLDNIFFPKEDTDYDLRAELEEKFDTIGAENMLYELAEFDPISAKNLHPNNRKRIIRAFEVFIQTGKTITEHNQNSKLTPADFEPIIIGITYEDRQILYNRINLRVDLMLKNGLLDEARTTFALNSTDGALQAIGHKELYCYFHNELTLDEAIERLKRQTRRYAKRQLTWFRRDKRINWIYADKSENVAKDAFLIIDKLLEE